MVLTVVSKISTFLLLLSKISYPNFIIYLRPTSEDYSC